jgi:pyridoxamine 5'-phosphate oxidase
VRDEADRTLDVGSFPTEPVPMVRRWLEEAEAAGIRLPNAIALATADADGRPSIRHVLLRGIEDGGFVFYTNRGSRKGRELAQNPRAAFALYWRELDRQITVSGDVDEVADAESDRYFASRPREARLGAWASRQSEPLASREELLERYAEAERRFADADVLRPPYWGGYRIRPLAVEFWQGRLHRLHDRVRYDHGADGWSLRRLAP